MQIRTLLLLPLAIAALAAASAVSASAQTPVKVIDTLPVTIKDPGNYALAGGVYSTQLSSGAAIEIAADGVDLDMTGALVDNLGVSAGSSIGVAAVGDRINVRVHGGTLRGFYAGVNFYNSKSRNGLFENIHVDYCTRYGITVDGWENVVRNNIITSIGAANTNAYGIQVFGNGVRVVGNEVSNMLPSGNAVVIGISVHVKSGTTDAIIEGNRVSNSNQFPNTYGIAVYNTASAIVINNRLQNCDRGLNVVVTATCKYRDNIALSCNTPYLGGTDAGNNN